MSSFRENVCIRQVTSVIWAVISDGRAACVFRYVKSERVLASGHVWKNSPYSQDRSFEENSIRSLPRPEGSTASHNVIEMAFGNRDALTECFASTVTERLQSSFDNKLFDHLVIVAPREISRALNGSLGLCLRPRLLGNMPQGYIYDKKGPLFIVRRKEWEAPATPDSMRRQPNRATHDTSREMSRLS